MRDRFDVHGTASIVAPRFNPVLSEKCPFWDVPFPIINFQRTVDFSRAHGAMESSLQLISCIGSVRLNFSTLQEMLFQTYTCSALGHILVLESENQAEIGQHSDCQDD